jgi:mitochondrial chaperone BCS1
MNCCFLSTTCKSFSNQTMGDALAQIPENALLVLEDVDSLFNEDRKNEDGSLTFSGMLNALDGFLSTDGVLTVMTTNHADRLDAALTRGGRVDRRFNFAKPVPSQIAALFRTFYPDAASGLAEEFARIVFGRPEGDAARSIATLQQLFIAQRRASPEECIACVPAFFEMYFPNGSGAKNTLYT